MKKILAMLLALVMVFALVACGGGNTTDTTSTNPNPTGDVVDTAPPAGVEGISDETLVIGTFGEPTYLVTQYNTTQQSVPVMNLIYDALLWYDNATGTVHPCIATEWEQIEDCVWRFHLRDDVVAYDGSILTAEDVYYSFEKGCSGTNTTAFKYFDMSKTAVVDEFTIDIGTHACVPYLDVMLSNIALTQIIDKSSVEANGGFDNCIRDPRCGTGPYKFSEWAEGEYILLTRNEEYWGELPYYKEIKLQFIGDAATRVMTLESGAADVVLNLAASAVGNLQSNPDVTVWNIPTDLSYVIYLNCTKTPLDNVLVRQAIAHLIDREGILAVAQRGFGVTLDTNIPQSHDYYVAPGEGESYAYDVEAAKALLAQAGYPDGFTFTLSIQGNMQTMGEAIQSALGQAGIEVKLDVLDTATMLKLYDTGEYDAVIAMGMYGGDLGKPLHYYDTRMDFDEADGGTGWGTAELDALIDIASYSRDPEAVAQAYAEIQSILRQNMPLIGLYSYDILYASSSDLTGLMVDIRGMAQMRNVRPIAE